MSGNTKRTAAAIAKYRMVESTMVVTGIMLR